MSTKENLAKRMLEKNTLLCVGLDPDMAKFPAELISWKEMQGVSDEEITFEFLKAVVDTTAEHVCAFKPQKAFFEGYKDGNALLGKVITYIHENHPGIPVLIDTKVGDVSNTYRAYLENLFGKLNADGITVNPYLGDDIFELTEKYEDKAFIALVKTSNPGATVVQEAMMADNKQLWRFMLELVANRWNKNRNLMIVMSSTTAGDYENVRKIIPDDMHVLAPGIGAQGGSLESIKPLLNSNRTGLVVNSSRGILYPYQPSDKDWRKKIEEAAIKTKNEINEMRSK